jgi:hypothetical protein
MDMPPPAAVEAIQAVVDEELQGEPPAETDDAAGDAQEHQEWEKSHFVKGNGLWEFDLNDLLRLPYPEFRHASAFAAVTMERRSSKTGKIYACTQDDWDAANEEEDTFKVCIGDAVFVTNSNQLHTSCQHPANCLQEDRWQIMVSNYCGICVVCVCVCLLYCICVAAYHIAPERFIQMIKVTSGSQPRVKSLFSAHR